MATAHHERVGKAPACNALVQSRPEIARLAREGGKPKAPEQGELL